MLQEQLIEEIKQIPNEKLAEIYDLIHYFRSGLASSPYRVKRNTGNCGMNSPTFHVASCGLLTERAKILAEAKAEVERMILGE